MLTNPLFPLEMFPSRVSTRRVRPKIMQKGTGAAGGMNCTTGEAYIPIEDSAYMRNVRRHEAMHAIYSRTVENTALSQGLEDMRIHVLGQSSINTLARRDELVCATKDLRSSMRNMAKLAEFPPASIRVSLIPFIRSVAILSFGCDNPITAKMIVTLAKQFESLLGRKGLLKAIEHAIECLRDGDRVADAKHALAPFMTLPKTLPPPTPKSTPQIAPQSSKPVFSPRVEEEETEDGDSETGDDSETETKEDQTETGETGDKSEKENQTEKETETGETGEDQTETETGDEDEETGDEDEETGEQIPESVSEDGSIAKDEETETGDDSETSDDSETGDEETGDEETGDEETGEDVPLSEDAASESFPSEQREGGIGGGESNIQQGLATKRITPETVALLPLELIEKLLARGSGRSGLNMLQMRIQTLDACMSKRITEGRNEKPQIAGAKIRSKRLHAALTPNPGRLFVRRGKRAGGTVLIDASGSMSLSDARLSSLAETLPIGQIAYYSGEGDKGTLTIYSRNRRCYALPKGRKLPNLTGGNDVDFTALQWLLQQPSPRYFVTDIEFCGGPDIAVQAAYVLAQRASDRKLVKFFPTLGHLEIELGIIAERDLDKHDRSFSERAALHIRKVLEGCTACGSMGTVYSHVRGEYDDCTLCEGKGTRDTSLLATLSATPYACDDD